MNSSVLEKTIVALADLGGHSYDYFAVQDKYAQPRSYGPQELPEFIEDLTEQAMKARLSLVVHAVTPDQMQALVERIEHPLLVFVQLPQGFQPAIFHEKKGQPLLQLVDEGGTRDQADALQAIASLVTHKHDAFPGKDGKVIMITALPITQLVSDGDQSGDHASPPSPVQRLFRLLGAEKKDIIYIYVYAIFIGIINLTLPLGIQALIGLVSGGLIFSSVLILIAVIIVGTLFTGGLQIMQVTMVEMLQRRVFAKASLEFAYRIPRMHLEALAKTYPPELVNRFFDVPTVQKGLPKLLIDLLAAVTQILFGITLLAFYHPFFIFFGLVLLAILVLIFRFTGPKGLEAALMVSKYKYKLANWFQEMARAIVPFKMAGRTNMPVKQTDTYVNGYLNYRKKYFNVLLSQYGWIVVFKTVVTGGLLILGTALVVDRQITLGQFVASEIVIITIISSVEKVVLNIDTVYDLLVGVEKIGHVTDVPLEQAGGADWQPSNPAGLSLSLKKVSYKPHSHSANALTNINLEIEAGSTVALTGTRGSGKSLLVKLIAGLLPSYTGTIAVDGLSIRDINKATLRQLIGENFVNREIFDACVLDNLTMGRKHISFEQVVQVARVLGLDAIVSNLPQGYGTNINSDGFMISGSTAYRISLARAILGRPRLLVVNDLENAFNKTEKLNLLSYLAQPSHGWTLLYITDDPLVMAAASRVLVLGEQGLTSYDDYSQYRDA